MDEDKNRTEMMKNCIDTANQLLDHPDCGIKGTAQIAATLFLADEIHALNETQQAILAVEREYMQTQIADTRLTHLQKYLHEKLRKISGASKVKLNFPYPETNNLQAVCTFSEGYTIEITVPPDMLDVKMPDFKRRIETALDHAKAEATKRKQRGDLNVIVKVRLEAKEGEAPPTPPK